MNQIALMSALGCNFGAKNPPRWIFAEVLETVASGTPVAPDQWRFVEDLSATGLVDLTAALPVLTKRGHVQLRRWSNLSPYGGVA